MRWTIIYINFFDYLNKITFKIWSERVMGGNPLDEEMIKYNSLHGASWKNSTIILIHVKGLIMNEMKKMKYKFY